jgi:hypothetical protein
MHTLAVAHALAKAVTVAAAAAAAETAAAGLNKKEAAEAARSATTTKNNNGSSACASGNTFVSLAHVFIIRRRVESQASPVGYHVAAHKL